MRKFILENSSNIIIKHKTVFLVIQSNFMSNKESFLKFILPCDSPKLR